LLDGSFIFVLSNKPYLSFSLISKRLCLTSHFFFTLFFFLLNEINLKLKLIQSLKISLITLLISFWSTVIEMVIKMQINFVFFFFRLLAKEKNETILLPDFHVI